MSRARVLEAVNSVQFQSNFQQGDSNMYVHMRKIQNSQNHFEKNHWLYSQEDSVVPLQRGNKETQSRNTPTSHRVLMGAPKQFNRKRKVFSTNGIGVISYMENIDLIWYTQFQLSLAYLQTSMREGIFPTTDWCLQRNRTVHNMELVLNKYLLHKRAMREKRSPY